MKSKDLQNILLSKYQNGDTPTKMFRDLNGGIGLRTIKRWCQMILQSGSITLSSPPGCPRLARAKGNIRKIKNRLRRNKRVSARKLSLELDISETRVRRILKSDLGLHPYKKFVEPLLSDDQKIKRKKFANWIRTNFRKEETMRILFSDEKFFDIDGVYNSQNDRVWAIGRADADKNGGIKQKRKFPQKQDGAKPNSHHLTQQWCRDRWPPNSPDVNPLDYSIWDELVNTINWNKVQSKTTLIQQIKSSFKNIRESVVFESCASFTDRLYRFCQNDGNYLR
ncbi:unnamed protein product [Rotaria socialis]|uniref:Transposase n=1 Tax=Rotaria socialis TaxID=392032 RepID=A0A820Y019_9BILA|nr:unnamed protein product [Rotaria socialis]CAF3338386.1 unnamed protein product [Rotaria socialis]CAF3470484.1 unnamed protein product [Rotaria socialis]CAF4535697.1 unnamed protein product [Rotaria socialis]CAF4537212.1 unnamed protein product [Rotaria socialis]